MGHPLRNQGVVELFFCDQPKREEELAKPELGGLRLIGGRFGYVKCHGKMLSISGRHIHGEFFVGMGRLSRSNRALGPG